MRSVSTDTHESISLSRRRPNLPTAREPTYVPHWQGECPPPRRQGRRRTRWRTTRRGEGRGSPGGGEGDEVAANPIFSYTSWRDDRFVYTKFPKGDPVCPRVAAPASMPRTPTKFAPIASTSVAPPARRACPTRYWVRVPSTVPTG